jgi:hypothetical protein
MCNVKGSKFEGITGRRARTRWVAKCGLVRVLHSTPTALKTLPPKVAKKKKSKKRDTPFGKFGDMTHKMQCPTISRKSNFVVEYAVRIHFFLKIKK